MSDGLTRPVLLLDDDGELFNVLAALEQILVELVAGGDEESYQHLGTDQLKAAHRVLLQLRAAESAPGVDLYDPSGCFEYCKLRVFCPLIADLEEIGRSLDEIRVAADSPHPNFIRETVEDITQMLAPLYVARLDPAYGTLTVDADQHQRLLCELAGEHMGKFILDVDQNAAYHSYIDRVLAIRRNDPLSGFLYGAPRC